ncbi:MAG TPA: type II toxin-antitoxin system RelE/ParE family toxin [Thermoanaerobaculia bacterium]
MWNDRLRIAESVLPQWKALNDAERAAARQALEIIDDDPIIGAPLFEPLRGYWSFSADGLRILYRIVAEARFVVILSITKMGSGL